MLYIDNLGLNIFAYSVFSNLNATETFGGHIVRPLDGCCIVVIYLERLVFDDFVMKAKIFEDISYLLESFCAFINRSNFSIYRAASCEGLLL